MSRPDGWTSSVSCSRSLKAVRMRLVLVCIVGHTPLSPASPLHCPPSVGACSKIVGSNPCANSQRAATSPPGPAPITATLPFIGELSHIKRQRRAKVGLIVIAQRKEALDGQVEVRILHCAVPP